MKIDCAQPPRIFIAPEVKQRLDLYIQSCKLEISGLGYATKVPGGFRILEVFILPQEVSMTATDLDVEAVGKFLTELIREDRDTELVKLWWHSHGDGTLFWSPTDTKTIDLFDNEWMISIVGNTKGQYRARIDLYSPLRLALDELPLDVSLTYSDELRQEVLAEIALKVREKKYIGFVKSWGRNPRQPYKWKVEDPSDGTAW